MINNFKLTSNQKKLLENFKFEVMQSNEKFNLTSINENEFDLKHIYDSLLLLEYCDWKYKIVADVGTGAGIPGMILAIVKPNTKFILIDSTKKKIEFINKFIKKYNIKNVKTIIGRIEEIKNIHVDLVISRAVSSLPILLEITSHFLKKNGELIFYKGKNIENEFCNKIKGEIKQLGLIFNKKIKYNLDINNQRSFVFYKKISNNLPDYPRKWKEIKKRNLCE